MGDIFLGGLHILCKVENVNEFCKCVCVRASTRAGTHTLTAWLQIGVMIPGQITMLFLDPDF